MATQITVLGMARPASGGELRFEVEWDDTNATPDPVDGLFDARGGNLILFRVVNTTQFTAIFSIRRPGRGAPRWINAVRIPPAAPERIFPPRGPVTQMLDVDTWQMELI